MEPPVDDEAAAVVPDDAPTVPRGTVERWEATHGPDAAAQLVAYAEALRNPGCNLMSTGDRARVADHVDDALAGFDVVRAGAHERIVDVGTGGGLPGVPLALVLPGSEFALVDSVAKKVRFVTETCDVLGIAARVDGRVVRAEDAFRGTESLQRASFDVAVARAVAPPGVVAEWLAPFVRVGGRLILWTTAAHAELEPLEAIAAQLGLAAPEPTSAPSPLRDDGVLLVWSKVAETPPLFPRRAGLARDKPLT